VPPADLLAYRRARPTPYIFSDAEISSLLDAAGELKHPLRAATHRALFGLLAVTGMREGEAVRLDRDDVDLDAGLLTIRNTKFNKSRQLPLHRSTVAVLHQYTKQRDRLCPRPATPSFFVSVVGRRLAQRRVRAVFSDLINQLGLQPRRGSRRPRIHDLRHSFAVTTMLDWYREDGDVTAKTPLLSAYLGHTSPSSTYCNRPFNVGHRDRGPDRMRVQRHAPHTSTWRSPALNSRSWTQSDEGAFTTTRAPAVLSDRTSQSLASAGASEWTDRRSYCGRSVRCRTCRIHGNELSLGHVSAGVRASAESDSDLPRRTANGYCAQAGWPPTAS
jgi:hypothetical protein